MRSPLGARLRQHREQQELCLATIADSTKINASLLEGLERDDLSRWPPAIYRRAYVRAYAAAIGLNADSILREFLQAYPEPAEIAEAPPPPTGLRGLVGSAMGSLSRIRQIGPPARGQTRLESADERIGRPEEAVPTIGRVEGPDKVPAGSPRPLDFDAAARLCTELGRVKTVAQIQPLLREAAMILGAKGLIVWLWDAQGAQLRPALVHGYPEHVVAQLPSVGRDDDNLTAAAFRSSKTLAVSGTAQASGALALPLLTPASCAGVLAIEFPGKEETGSAQAVATFFAAMLARHVGDVRSSAAATGAAGGRQRCSANTQSDGAPSP